MLHFPGPQILQLASVPPAAAAALKDKNNPQLAVAAAFQSAKALFDLDDDVKLDSLKQLDPLSNTGYFGFGKEALNRNRLPDLKEVFNSL